MKSISTFSTTGIIGAPPDWDREEPCNGLPVTQEDGLIYSYWRPTWIERVHVLFGWPVRLCVAGDRHPAVAIDVARAGR